MIQRECTLLDEIRARPAMFVPSYLDLGESRALSDLELFLRGYEASLSEQEPRFILDFSSVLHPFWPVCPAQKERWC